MRTLDRKLLRDLQRLWGQTLSIALVLAAGVATLILGVGAYQSLYETREAYYERQRFADVFASATRAPLALLDELRAIDGVASVEVRISGYALLDIAGFSRPATGRIVSLPETGRPALNDVRLHTGRMPDPDHVDEVIVSASFAKAQNVGPGDTLAAVIEGNKRTLRIVGVAYSPEFIYALGPGDLLPDNYRFTAMWMPRKSAEAAFDMDGAFNEVSLALLRGASSGDVMDRVDTLLERYGGTGSYIRKDHPSHAFIEAELGELEAMSQIMPPIFIGVAAFLINMTLGRLIAMEREQIGLLKALGYRSWAIAWHYLQFALVVALIGFVVGAAAGLWLGRGLTVLYAGFFDFPFLYFTRSVDVYVLAFLIALGASIVGALRAVYGAIRLAPAVAMAPAPPADFGKTWVAILSAALPRLSQLSMMIVRQLVRWPVRALGTVVGLSLSVALLVTSLFAGDSIAVMIDVSFFQTDREDATLVFYEKRPLRAVEAVRRLPGVMSAEPYRSIPIRLTFEHRERRTALLGKPPNADLGRVIDRDFVPVPLPTRGIAIADKLARLLHIKQGDVVQVELLDGSGQIVDAPVRSIITSYLGLSAYADLTALNRLVGDDDVVDGVRFDYDPVHEEALFTAVKTMPSAAAIALRRVSLENFHNTLAQNIVIMTTVYLALAGVIAFGVVYSTARIRLSERARELASLRVLGFTRGEVAWVLFGEFVVIIGAAVPLGWIIGYGLTYVLITRLGGEQYDVPFIIEPDTYATAALAVTVAAAISAAIVNRRIRNLDMIQVLKTRE